MRPDAARPAAVPSQAPSDVRSPWTEAYELWGLLILSALVGSVVWLRVRRARRLSAPSAPPPAAPPREKHLSDFRHDAIRYKTFVESSPDLVWEVNEAGVYTYVSPNSSSVLGYEPKELLGRTPFDVMPPEDARAAAARFADFVRARKPFALLIRRVLYKGGQERVMECSGNPFFDESGRLKGYRGVDRDITARTRLEEEFRQAQKMEAIGRLAGGVAHDFNNILTAILGYGELLSRAVEGRRDLAAYAGEVMKAGDMARSLTSQLLAFSRRQILAPKVLDLNEVLDPMERMLARLVGETITLRKELSPSPVLIRADAGQVQQVVLNLVVNAKDAMPSGGALTLRTKRVDFGETQGTEAPAGTYVVLEVEDSGEGMDESTLRHLFEPFFTTKKLGQGTGLGLSTVYGIVRQSGGHIAVESEPGRGSTFRIYLPMVEEPLRRAPTTVVPPLLRSGSETVLVVEDAESVLKLACEALRKVGYEVLQAPDGAAAMRVADSYAGEIQLLLTDLVMPSMGGTELGARLLRKRPSLKVLYTSGYADSVALTAEFLASKPEFLAKPYLPTELLEKVRRVLDGRSGQHWLQAAAR